MQEVLEHHEAIVLGQERHMRLEFAQKGHELGGRPIVCELASVKALLLQHRIKEVPSDAAPLAALVHIEVKNAQRAGTLQLSGRLHGWDAQ